MRSTKLLPRSYLVANADGTGDIHEIDELQCRSWRGGWYFCEYYGYGGPPDDPADEYRPLSGGIGDLRCRGVPEHWERSNRIDRSEKEEA
jgi:hypothetical protein